MSAFLVTSLLGMTCMVGKRNVAEAAGEPGVSGPLYPLNTRGLLHGAVRSIQAKVEDDSWQTHDSGYSD
jgi:hypothetical protein